MALPKKIVVKDGEGNIKNTQVYDHTKEGDPTYFKKTLGNGELIIHLEYDYIYDENGNKLKMTINDKLKNTSTVMEYEY